MNDRIFDIKKNIVFMCDDDGLTRSINDKLYALDEYHILSSVILDSDRLPVGAMATFSFGNEVGNFGVPTISLGVNNFHYDDESHVLSGYSIETALYLHHELIHFVHFCLDNGVYTHPNLTQYKRYDVKAYFDNGIASKDKKTAKAVEIECGWRCLFDDVQYEVAPDVAFADKRIQLANIFAYEDNIFENEEQRLLYDKELSDTGRKKLRDDCISQMQFKELCCDKPFKYIFHWNKYNDVS